MVALLGFGALNYLPVLLSLTLFISVLLTLSRSYRDSEMVVWFSCGLPLTAWVKSGADVRRCRWSRRSAVLSLVLVALGAVEERGIPTEAWISRDDVSRVSPGRVQGIRARPTACFSSRRWPATKARVKNVFISSVQHGRLGVMAAAQGHSETMPNGDRFLVLENGRRYEGTPGQAEYRVMEFERYAVRIETREARGIEETPKNLPLWELVRNPTCPNLGELLWRIGIPLAALNLALLAIPLSFVNPRAGRTNNLVFALLTYMIYSNLISVSQAWVAQGRLALRTRRLGWCMS